MLGMTPFQTSFILLVLILAGTLLLAGLTQEIGKTRRAKHDADKKSAEARIAEIGRRQA